MQAQAWSVAALLFAQDHDARGGNGSCSAVDAGGGTMQTHLNRTPWTFLLARDGSGLWTLPAQLQGMGPTAGRMGKMCWRALVCSFSAPSALQQRLVSWWRYSGSTA